jgi:hypothetical protein
MALVEYLGTVLYVETILYLGRLPTFAEKG